MPSLSAYLVGAFFHPPAKALLDHLPTGTRLTLVPEPTNQFDPCAILVQVSSSQIPSNQFEELTPKLANFGLTLEEFLTQDLWTLGYVNAKPPKHNPCADSAQSLSRLSNLPAQATLGWDLSNHPTLTIKDPTTQANQVPSS